MYLIIFNNFLHSFLKMAFTNEDLSTAERFSVYRRECEKKHQLLLPV